MPLLDFLLPAVRGRGQGAPDGRDRLHRRPPPLGRDRRAPRRSATASATTSLVEVEHRDIDRASGYGDADPSGTTSESRRCSRSRGAADGASRDGAATTPPPAPVRPARAPAAPMPTSDDAASDGAPADTTGTDRPAG